MNHIYKLQLILFTGLLIFSCDTDLDINQSPDLLKPNQIPMSSGLPAGETAIAGAKGSYFALIGGFWSQFWTQSAVANQYKYLDDYSLNPVHSINSSGWANMYDGLTDIRNIKRTALEKENWNFYLIATALEVYSSQIITDFYGAIPYSEANNTEILNPAFETQEAIYDKMAADLKEALGKDLSESPSDEKPGETDFIFSGNMSRWVKFANTLLLRIYLRQTEVRPSVAESGVIELLNGGTEFLDTDAAITVFTDEDSKSNPLYESDRRQLNVGTNLRASHTLGSYLNSNSDPRLAKFYDGTTFQYQGNFDKGSGSASVVELAPTDPVYFISLAESKFLQAEADVRYKNGANAKNLYEAGLTAAFDQWGLTPGDLVTGAYAFPDGSQEEKIKAIITQKLISFFPGRGYEAFFEHNRTGYPKTTTLQQSNPNYVPGEFAYSIEGLTGGLFPKRIPYPEDESQRNSNTPAVIKLTESVWYDAN